MVLSRSSSTSYLRLCILSALGVFAVSATAATNDLNIVSDSELPQVELDKIVVTATRTPTKTSNVIAQTRVVDKEDLQRFQGQTVLEVLKRQPGISYYGNGGMDKKNNFYMRGYDSKQILVLIDGIRYSSLSAGGATLNLLPAEQIERIEILYGASGSSIYGADAMGGVIQIFTKGTNVEKSNFSVTAGVGSHNQYLYGASAQFANGDGTALSLSASHNETKSISAKLPSASGYNKDNDGFESNNFSISLNQRINEQWSAGASALYSKSTSEFDSGAQDAYSDQENGSANTYIQYKTPSTVSKLSYGQSIDKSTSHDANAIDYEKGSKFDTTQDQARLETRIDAKPGTVIVGAEWLSQKLEASDVKVFTNFPDFVVTAYEPDDRTVKSAFVGYQLADSYYDLQANYRVDDNSQYGNKTTYNLGGAYHINPNFRVGTSYAKGFRAPTFNELYFPGYDNPELKPETSDNYEAFIEYDTLLQSTRLTGYQNTVDDLINFVARFDGNTYIGGNSQNIEEAEIKGISLTSDWVINDYLFGGSYDYQQAKDSSGGFNDGNFLPIRPENKGLVYVGYRLPSLDIRAEYQYVDDYYYSISNADSQLVESYGLLNISGNYQLTNNLSMTARLNNITNKKYVTAPGYNTDGTNFFTSLTYNWF